MLLFIAHNMCLIALPHKYIVKKTVRSEIGSAGYGTLRCKAVYFRNRHESSACGNTPKGVNKIFHLRTLTIYQVDILPPVKRHLISLQKFMRGIRLPPRCQ